MENNRVKEESIEKYYNALLELRNVLKYTNRISLDDFSIKNNLSKNLSKVLQKGGIIKCIKKGRFSEWEWTTIEPTNHMAVKVIQLLGDVNPERIKTDNVKIKANELIRICNILVKENKEFSVSDFLNIYDNNNNPLRVKKFFNSRNSKLLINKYFERRHLRNEFLDWTYEDRTRKWKQKIEVLDKNTSKNLENKKTIVIKFFWGLFSFTVNI